MLVNQGCWDVGRLFFLLLLIIIMIIIIISCCFHVVCCTLTSVLHKLPSGFRPRESACASRRVGGVCNLPTAKKSVGNPGRPSNRYRNIPGVPMGGWAAGRAGGKELRGARGRRELPKGTEGGRRANGGKKESEGETVDGKEEERGWAEGLEGGGGGGWVGWGRVKGDGGGSNGWWRSV